MGVDFHDPVNRRIYAGREADASWRRAIGKLVDPVRAVVVDVGCGGGIYTRAWHDLGAQSVIGIDFSEPTLDEARTAHGHLPGITFRLGDAAATGLPDREADVVFERALIHHVADLAAVVTEAARLLRPGGTLLIQDRTPDDVARPGSPEHPRGWLFEVFPRLLEVENGRRPTSDAVSRVLAAAGFDDVTTTSLEEIRRRYADREEYLADIASRTGRSILHELDDAELDRLITELRRRLPNGPVVEQDRWTLWRAVAQA